MTPNRRCRDMDMGFFFFKVASDIFTDLLPHIGEPELDQGHNGNEDKNHDWNRRGKPIVDTPTALKGQVVHIADQNVCVPGPGGGTRNGRTALDEHINQVEIVEVENERSNQQRPDSHKQ